MQRVIRFAAGRSRPRSDEAHDELLYVVSGRGAVDPRRQLHELATGAACHVTAGDGTPSTAPATTISCSCRCSPADRPRRRTGSGPGSRRPPRGPPGAARGREADVPRPLRRGPGCAHATQFVGYVEPYRAPDHSHPYDEVGYVLGGTGLAHLGGEPIPLGPGSCFHLPPGHVHCIENSGAGVMEIVGVFHPPASPAAGPTTMQRGGKTDPTT